MSMQKNVLGTPLRICSRKPLTGYFRNGCCETDEDDRGSHTVCVNVTQEFLEYLSLRGNDLITPQPEYGFAGLKPGDRWCVCADSWLDAFLHKKAAPIVLEATHEVLLEKISLEHLKGFSSVKN